MFSHNHTIASYIGLCDTVLALCPDLCEWNTHVHMHRESIVQLIMLIYPTPSEVEVWFINLSSASSVQPTPLLTVYGATKVTYLKILLSALNFIILSFIRCMPHIDIRCLLLSFPSIQVCWERNHCTGMGTLSMHCTIFWQIHFFYWCLVCETILCCYCND